MRRAPFVVQCRQHFRHFPRFAGELPEREAFYKQKCGYRLIIDTLAGFYLLKKLIVYPPTMTSLPFLSSQLNLSGIPYAD